MMELGSHNGYRFIVSKDFKGEYLLPVIDNLKTKYRDNFDDYDEVYHCNQLIHRLQRDRDIDVDFHLMYQYHQCVGLAVISTGKINSLEYLGEEFFKEDDNVMILNYFYISSKARGNSSYWLKKIIMPQYVDKEYLYLKSTHSRAFSLYERLGKEVGAFEKLSDNGDFIRKGKIFKVKVKR